MSIKIIASVSSNGVIGKDGTLPFHYSEDLKHFKKMTLDSIVIMGRKTFESIGKPLPKRKNVVISASTSKNIVPGIETFSNLCYAINHCKNDSYLEDIWLIGGSSIYREGMNYADEIMLTITPDVIEGDNLTFFPWINPKIFKIHDVRNFDGDSELKLYRFIKNNSNAIFV